MKVKGLEYIKTRFREASTWAGIGLAFTAGAAFYRWMIVGAVVSGIVAVFTPDYTPPKS